MNLKTTKIPVWFIHRPHCRSSFMVVPPCYLLLIILVNTAFENVASYFAYSFAAFIDHFAGQLNFILLQFVPNCRRAQLRYCFIDSFFFVHSDKKSLNRPVEVDKEWSAFGSNSLFSIDFMKGFRSSQVLVLWNPWMNVQEQTNHNIFLRVKQTWTLPVFGWKQSP